MHILQTVSVKRPISAAGQTDPGIRAAPFVTLARMSEWRKRHQRLKPAIDMARGMLVTLFLFPGRRRARPETLPGLPEVDRLCLLLETTGEFREQALRGEFTSNVEPFLREAHDRYRWREDRFQCTRSRAEYHLNMVGAEIMNRAFRDAFTSTVMKSVLHPGCMRGRPEGECEATRVREGLVCEGCLPDCRKHWRRDGIPTALNMRELKRILGDPRGPAHEDSSFDISPELP